MARAERHRGCGARKVDFVGAVVSKLGGCLQSVDFFGGERLEIVDGHTDFLLLVGRNSAEVGHEGVQRPLLAKIFDAERLDGFSILGGSGLDFGLQCVYFLKHMLLEFLLLVGFRMQIYAFFGYTPKRRPAMFTQVYRLRNIKI